MRLNSLQVWEIRAAECKLAPNRSASAVPDFPASSALTALSTLPALSTLFDSDSDHLHEQITHLSLTAAEIDPTEPRTYKQAMASPESSLWQATMDKEIASMHSQNVWTVVPTPPNRNIVGSKWLFRLKRNEYGEISRYKAD